ncbi:HD domain-containing protein [Candidatus Micrarchaeota archaeon]|nr:HD domain-containing protein [Candidatus Micrarchaeota archaeon]
MSDRLKTEIGIEPISIRTKEIGGIHDVIRLIHDALNNAIGSDSRGNQVSAGLGQPVILRGSFTDEQLKRLKSATLPYRIEPIIADISKKVKVKEVAKEVVEKHTAKKVTEEELKTLDRKVAAAPFPDRAAYEICSFLHKYLLEGPSEKTHTEGSTSLALVGRQSSSSLVMSTRPDPFSTGEQEDDPNVDYLTYKAEIGSGEKTKLPRMKVDDDQFRITRIFRGKENNVDENGEPTDVLTTRLSKQPKRKKFIDQRLGYTPRTEGVLFLGRIPDHIREAYEIYMDVPEHPIGALHFYRNKPLTRIAFEHMKEIVGRTPLVEKFLDLWKNEEMRYHTNAGAAFDLKRLEAHDPYTKGHSQRVAKLTEIITRKLLQNHYEKTGKWLFSREQFSAVLWAGLLHDVGKLGTRAETLQKKDLLNDEEFKEIREHPDNAKTILLPKRVGRFIRDAAIHHHEKMNGTGYPDGLKGEQIPLIARIVGVADVMDAFLTERDYVRTIKRDHNGNLVGKKQYSWESIKELVNKWTVEKNEYDRGVVDAALSITPEELTDAYGDYKSPSGKKLLLNKNQEGPWEIKKASKQQKPSGLARLREFFNRTKSFFGLNRIRELFGKKSG